MMPKRLTDKGLQALKRADAGETYDVADSVVPNLIVRVSPKGRRTFALYTRFPNTWYPARRTIGKYGSMTLDQARQKARYWLELIEKGRDPADEALKAKHAEERKRANSFRSVFEDFVAEKLKKERKGREVERDMRKAFLEPWNGRPVTDIMPEDIALIIKAKARTAQGQARNLLLNIKRMFQWACDQHAYGIKLNPAAPLKPLALCGETVVRDRLLDDAEVFAFLRAARRTAYPHGPVYQLLLLTGLRLNEVADAAWSEFDLAKGIWTIPATRMKARESKARPHVVPLTGEILAVINSLPRFERGEYLFSNDFGRSPIWMGTRVKERMDERMLRTLRAMARKRGDNWRKVKLEHWQNHDLRRVVRSGLSKLKVVDEVAEAVLAHRRKGIQGVYDRHDYLAEKKEALQIWAGRLRDITEPPPANVTPLRKAGT
jgi:integrase